MTESCFLFYSLLQFSPVDHPFPPVYPSVHVLFPFYLLSTVHPLRTFPFSLDPPVDYPVYSVPKTQLYFPWQLLLSARGLVYLRCVIECMFRVGF